MYYEINVAWNKRHLFATHERSLTNEQDARHLLEVFRDKFPAAEGYEVKVSYRENTGRYLDW
jgi:hypothetical protein